MQISMNILKIFKSFKNAINGITYTLKNERHMRFHIVASVAILVLSLFFKLNAENYCILFLTMAFVIISEFFNTAIENVIDIESENYSVVAKIAKDVAAGAVLVAAIFSVVVGICLFHDMYCYINMFLFLLLHPVCLLGLVLFGILSYFYVVWGPVEIKNKIKKVVRTLKGKSKT